MRFPFRKTPATPALDPFVAALSPAAAPYVMIDTELTGLDLRKDSILSLGGVRMNQGRIDLRNTYYQEIDPGRALDPESILIHGITPAETRGKPAIEAVLAGFAAFCGRGILVGHFIGLDLMFLRKELARVPGLELSNPALDTWPLYEWLSSRTPGDGGSGLPRLKDPRLTALAEALRVDCRGAHNALSDSFVTAQVFQRLLQQATRYGIGTVAELLRIGNPDAVLGHHEGAIPLN